MSSTTTMSASAERRWSSSSMGKEKFPDFDRSTSGDYLATIDGSSSRTPSPAKTNGILHSERWQPRKDHHLVWDNGQINVTPPRHNRQRSLSDAFKTIRSRKASVGENAREVAEALKAPVSMKIVVSRPFRFPCISRLMAVPDPLPHLVPKLRLDQYFFEIYTQCFPQTNYAHYHTIRLRLWLVPLLCMASTHLSPPKNRHSSTEERHSISKPRCNIYDNPSGTLPDRRAYTFFHSYREDSSISRAHH